MTDPRTPRTPTALRLGHEDFCVPARGCSCRMLVFAAIEAEASEDVRAAAREAVRWLEHGTDRAEGDAATASRLRAALAADPALSDPDAERQRAIGARCPCRASTAAPDICTACGHREHGRLGCDAALPAAQEPER
jgi:hypothetical protein